MKLRGTEQMSRKFLYWWLGIALMCFISVQARAGWELVWSDEFNQPDGSAPDASKWGFDTGNGGWGNSELEYYTSRTNNARIENDQLVIEAKAENYGGSSYTSARLLTRGKWSWTYGRIEARIKIPRGQGMWPAFWMLGDNIGSVGWPTCGEIDIMENIGKEPDTVHGTIHGPGYSGSNGIGGPYSLPGEAAFADDYHVFAIEWTTNLIKWFVDGQQYFSVTPASLGGNTWVFNQPQFLLLNLAVGGQWPGNPDGTTVFPQQMLVDYVRVYNYVASAPSAPTGLSAATGDGKVYLNWDASASGASAYNVKRATSSDGSFVTIASPATNSFTDPSVADCSTYFYKVSATNSLGESTNSSVVSAALGAFSLAVNCGGETAAQFEPDGGFAGGTPASSAVTVDTSGVTNPAPQSVYQTERYGNFSYTIGGLTTGLSYRVRLHFAEFYWTTVGQRVFNVFINGIQVLTNFDIFAAAGTQNKAVVREFAAVASSGQIVIQFATVTDNAKCSGIEISLPQTPAPTAGNNGPIWSGMNLQLTASAVPGATYHWTGPNGFQSSEQNPVLMNANTNDSGLFTVTAEAASCVSVPAFTSVTVNPPAQLTFESQGDDLVVSWPVGTLQSATNLDGPWNDLNDAASPLTNPAAMSRQFFRLKLP